MSNKLRKSVQTCRLMLGPNGELVHFYKICSEGNRHQYEPVGAQAAYLGLAHARPHSPRYT